MFENFTQEVQNTFTVWCRPAVRTSVFDLIQSAEWQKGATNSALGRFLLKSWLWFQCLTPKHCKGSKIKSMGFFPLSDVHDNGKATTKPLAVLKGTEGGHG